MIEFTTIMNDVLKYYPQESKYYHSKYHIIDMITQLFIYWEDFLKHCYYENVQADCNYKLIHNKEKSLEIIILAIIFHDVIYTVGRKDNEEKSAKFALEYLKDYQYKQEVAELILSTKVNNTLFDTAEKCILHDLDWSGFKSYNNMIYNEELIKNEAIRDGFTEEQFKEGQKKFYQMIENYSIYKIFWKDNDIAHDNISKRIKEM